MSTEIEAKSLTPSNDVPEARASESTPNADSKRSRGSGRSTLAMVGIGASAGGLEAVRKFFAAVPSSMRAAFVLVQHLDPSHDSLMVDLLTRYTTTKVLQVQDGMAVEVGCVYIIPPNSALTVEKGVLHLSEPVKRRGIRMPIDHFFNSLADDQQERAVGIVLTGTGSDGTLGIRMVKARGGMTMAQDPETAQYDGMPRSAIATGDVDYVLPVEKMPEVLMRYFEHAYVHGAGQLPERKDQDYLDNILALLLARVGHDFRYYKRGTIQRRILRRMGINQIEQLADYHQVLRRNPKEINDLSKDLLIGVTAFFREPEAWTALKEKVLRPIVDSHPEQDPIRIWVPGCATGEEAYSLAMSLLECLEARNRHNNVLIFATDIDKEALEVARAALYPESITASLSAGRLGQFFVREGDKCRVKKAVREMIMFAAQNVITDPPFSNLDLVSCRNLMIYLEPDLQQRLLGVFHFALRTGGYLFLGNSETVGNRRNVFAPIAKKCRIYQRIGSSRLAHLDLPLSPARLVPVQEPRAPGERRAPPTLGQIVQRQLLERYAPAAVLVNREYQTLYFFGPTSNYISQPSGERTDDLLAMAGEGLRPKLRNALHQALGSREVATLGGAHIKRGDTWHGANVSVARVGDAGDQSSLFLVTFEDEPQTEATRSPPVLPGSPEETVLRQLEEELKATREELRSTIEQMETGNEELKASNEEVMSMNEELQSTNEELETSKEELQSLNEELTTLNSQLEEKIHELETTNNDLSNLLASTDLATVFLDRGLRIKRFTPASMRLMRLIPADEGRAITDIAWRFSDEELLPDAREVLAGGECVQREIRSECDQWYIRRVLPYRIEEEGIRGVVLTFTNITERKRAEEALKHSEETLRRVTDAVPVLIGYVDREQRYRFNNATFGHWFDVDFHAIQGQHLQDVLGGAVYQKIKGHIEAALSGQRVSFEAQLPYRVGGSRSVHVDYIPDVRSDGIADGYFELVTDISERQHAEAEIKRLNRELKRRLDETQALFRAAPIGIFVSRDAACRDMTMNPAGARLLGLPEGANPSNSASDAKRLPFKMRRDERELRPDELPMQYAAAHNEPVEDMELELVREDGKTIRLVTYAAPLHDETGQVRGCLGTFVDVTARRAAERNLRDALRRLRLHVENSPLAVIEWTAELVITRWNDGAERLFGWPAERVCGQRLDQLPWLRKHDADQIGQAMHELLTGGQARATHTSRHFREDGTIVHCEWYESALRDPTGEVLSILCLALDVTDRERATQALFEEKERAQITLQSIGDGVITTDAQGIVSYLNPVAESLTGWSVEAAQGTPLKAVFPIVSERSRESAANPVEVCLTKHRIMTLDDDCLLISRSGQEHAIEDSAAPICDADGEVVGAVLVFHEVTEKRRRVRSMAQQAQQDPLTGLINRREFKRRLERAVASSREYGWQHALCYLDLDRFKMVNDHAGHAAGDQLLKQMTALFRERIRERDTLARLGGDEFGLLLDNCPFAKAVDIAQSLVAEVNSFGFFWDDRSFEIGTSVGLAMITPECDSASQVLTEADAACCRAKERGRNRLHIYDANDGESKRPSDPTLHVAGLQEALEAERFRLYCQPIHWLASREPHPARLEILLRLVDAEGNLRLPGAFIPAAERYGFMAVIDRWVIATVLRRYAELFQTDAGPEIAINLSGNALGDEAFLEFVQKQIQDSPVAPERVCFEIGEPAALQNWAQTRRFVGKMKTAGCRFTLDDFGVGISSFSYLKALPVDDLKIEGSFVRDMAADPVDNVMVAAINQIGHVMGKRTIVQFAENEAIVACAREMGVDYAQGYALGAPRPLEDCLS
jgi:two-component system CheB/CheR fusion protein